MTANLLLPRKSLSKHDPASIRSQEKQTAPCREGHRYAGPVAVVPLPQQTPSDGVKPSNPDLSQAVSPSPLRRHNARGPRHTRRWTSSSLSSPCRRHRTLAIRMMNGVAPSFKIPIKQPSCARRTTASRCATHARASAAIIASQVVACAIFRRFTTPELPSKAEQPATVRCKPSHPTVMVPQALPSDAVPRRTDNCPAMSTVAVRCKQPDPTSM